MELETLHLKAERAHSPNKASPVTASLHLN